MSVGTLINRKSRASDVLMNYNFHVLDVSVETPIVLSLAYGFQACTAPEIIVNNRKVKEGTFPYPHSVFESAEASDITLTNGAKFFDSDFYDWVTSYIAGKTNTRRNFMIIQYSQINVNSAFGAIGIQNILPSGISFGSFFDIISRVPARAWLCKSCVPVSYKASDDFDALSHAPSLQHLTFSMKFFEEFNTGA